MRDYILVEITEVFQGLIPFREWCGAKLIICNSIEKYCFKGNQALSMGRDLPGIIQICYDVLIALPSYFRLVP